MIRVEAISVKNEYRNELLPAFADKSEIHF
jgi:hypothetical protein